MEQVVFAGRGKHDLLYKILEYNEIACICGVGDVTVICGKSIFIL
jgi:hypothetical protein